MQRKREKKNKINEKKNYSAPIEIDLIEHKSDVEILLTPKQNIKFKNKIDLLILKVKNKIKKQQSKSDKVILKISAFKIRNVVC